MKYNFDEIVDRKNTNSQNVEGWRSYIFKCGPDKNFVMPTMSLSECG